MASPMPMRRLMKPNSELRIPQSPLMRRKEFPLIEREEPPPCDRLAHMLKDSGGDDTEMGDGSKFDRFSPARKTTRRPLVRTSTKDGDLVPKEEEARKDSRLEKQTAVDEASPVTPRPTGINRSLAEMLTKSEEPKGLRRSSSESIKRPAFLSSRTTTTTPTLRSKLLEQPKSSSLVQRTQSLGRTASAPSKEEKPRLGRQLIRTPSQGIKEAVERTNSISSLRSSKSSIASNPPSKQAPVVVRKSSIGTVKDVTPRKNSGGEVPRKPSTESRFGYKPTVASPGVGTGTQVKRTASLASRPKRSDSIGSKENLRSATLTSPSSKLSRSKPTSLSFMRPTAASTSKESTSGSGEPQSPGTTVPTSRIHRLAMKPVAQAKWT